MASDNKAEVEKHCQDKHGSTSVMMRIYYVDPTSISNLDPNVASKLDKKEYFSIYVSIDTFKLVLDHLFESFRANLLSWI